MADVRGKKCPMLCTFHAHHGKPCAEHDEDFPGEVNWMYGKIFCSGRHNGKDVVGCPYARKEKK